MRCTEWRYFHFSVTSSEKQERKSIYIAPFILRIVSKRSDKSHSLPANYTMPAFPS